MNRQEFEALVAVPRFRLMDKLSQLSEKDLIEIKQSGSLPSLIENELDWIVYNTYISGSRKVYDQAFSKIIDINLNLPFFDIDFKKEDLPNA